MHPSVVKAQRIASIAKENGWQGKISSEVVNRSRITTLVAQRNDESIAVAWENGLMTSASYWIFDHHIQLTCAKHVVLMVKGWPDIIKLFEWFPNKSRIELSEKYVRLPFDWETDSDEDILDCLVGKEIWWYSSVSGKIRHETAMIPRKKSQVFNLKQINHRRMFNFCTVDTGMRSVMLDMILKVQ